MTHETPSVNFGSIDSSGSSRETKATGASTVNLSRYGNVGVGPMGVGPKAYIKHKPPKQGPTTLLARDQLLLSLFKCTKI